MDAAKPPTSKTPNYIICNNLRHKKKSEIKDIPFLGEPPRHHCHQRFGLQVATVVDGKADQTDVEALKQAMLRLDVTVAKNRGVQAAREAEAIGALQAAFKEMSSSMQGSMQKLQKVLFCPRYFDHCSVWFGSAFRMLT